MKYLGIDIGGTKCAVVLGNENLNVINKVSFPTTSFDETLKRIIDAAKYIGDFDAIGVSCGGPLDSEKGIIISPPNLPDWENVEIVKILEKEFGVPSMLKNDEDVAIMFTPTLSDYSSITLNVKSVVNKTTATIATPRPKAVAIRAEAIPVATAADWLP